MINMPTKTDARRLATEAMRERYHPGPERKAALDGVKVALTEGTSPAHTLTEWEQAKAAEREAMARLTGSLSGLHALGVSEAELLRSVKINRQTLRRAIAEVRGRLAASRAV